MNISNIPQDGFFIDGMKVQVRAKETPRKNEYINVNLNMKSTEQGRRKKQCNQTTVLVEGQGLVEQPREDANLALRAFDEGKSSIVDQLLKNSTFGETLPQSESKRSERDANQWNIKQIIDAQVATTARPESGRQTLEAGGLEQAEELSRIGLECNSVADGNTSPEVAGGSNKKKGQLAISTSDERIKANKDQGERIQVPAQPTELIGTCDQLSQVNRKSPRRSPAASPKQESGSKSKPSPGRTQNLITYRGSSTSIDDHQKLFVDDTDAAEDSADTKDSLDPNFLLTELYHHNMKDILGFSQFKKKTLNHLEENMKQRGILPSSGSLHDVIESLQKLPKAQIKQILKEKQQELGQEKKLFGINHLTTYYKQSQSPSKIQATSPIFKAQGFKSKLVYSEQYKSGQMKKFTDAFRALKNENGNKESPKGKTGYMTAKSRDNAGRRSTRNRDPFKQHQGHKDSVNSYFVAQNTTLVQTSILSPNSSAYNGAGATSLSSSKGMTPNYTSGTLANANSRASKYNTLNKWPQFPMNKEGRRKEELEGKRMSLQQKESSAKLRKGPFPATNPLPFEEIAYNTACEGKNQSSKYMSLGVTAATPLNNMPDKKKLEIFQGYEDIKESQVDDCESPIYQALRREASEDLQSTLQQQLTVKGGELIQVQPAEIEKEMIDQEQQQAQNTQHTQLNSLNSQHHNEETHSTNQPVASVIQEGELGSNSGEVVLQESQPMFPSLNPELLLEKINEVKKAAEVKQQLRNVEHYDSLCQHRKHPQSNSVFQLDQHLFDFVKQGIETQHSKQNPVRNKKLPGTLIHKQSYLVSSDMPMMISQSKFNVASTKNTLGKSRQTNILNHTMQNDSGANGDVKVPFLSCQRNQSNSMMSSYIYERVNPSKLDAIHKQGTVCRKNRASSNSQVGSKAGSAQGPAGVENSQRASHLNEKSARETFYIAEQASKDLHEISDHHHEPQREVEQQVSLGVSPTGQQESHGADCGESTAKQHDVVCIKRQAAALLSATEQHQSQRSTLAKQQRREANRSINNMTITGKPTVLSVIELRGRASKDGAADPASPRSSENGGLVSQLLRATINNNQQSDSKEGAVLQTRVIMRQEASKTISPTASLSPIRRPQFHLDTINTISATRPSNAIIKLSQLPKPQQSGHCWTTRRSQKHEIMKPVAPLQEKYAMENRSPTQTVQACRGGNTPRRYMDSEGRSQEFISSSREKLLSQEIQRSLNQTRNILERNYGATSSAQRSPRKSKVRDWQQLDNVLHILQAKGQILNRSLNWKAKLKGKNHNPKFNIHDKSRRQTAKQAPEMIAPPDFRYQGLVTQANRKISIPKQLNLDLVDKKQQLMQIQRHKNQLSRTRIGVEDHSLLIESQTALTGSIPSPAQLRKPRLQNTQTATRINTQYNSSLGSTFQLNASATGQPQPQVRQNNIGNKEGPYIDGVANMDLASETCQNGHKKQQPPPLFEGKKPAHPARALKIMDVDSSAASQTRTAQKIAHRDSCDSIASSNESNLKINIINVHNMQTPYVSNHAIATHDYSCQIAETKMPGIRTHLQKIETEYVIYDDGADKSNSNRSPTKTHETTHDANQKALQMERPIGLQKRDIQVVKYQMSLEMKNGNSTSIPATNSPPKQDGEYLMDNPKTVVYSELSQQYRSQENSDEVKQDSGREIEVVNDDSENDSDTVVTVNPTPERIEEMSVGGRAQAPINVQESMHMTSEAPAEEKHGQSPRLEKVKRLTAARKKKYKQARWPRANNQSLNTTLPELLQTTTSMHPNTMAPATSPFHHRSLQYETFHHQDRLASQNMMVGGNQMSIKRARQSDHQTAQSINKHGVRSPVRLEENDISNQSVIVNARNNAMYNNDQHNNTLNVSQIWVKPFELNSMDKTERYRRTKQYGQHISQQIKNQKSINVKDSFKIVQTSDRAPGGFFSIPAGSSMAPSLLPSTASRDHSLRKGQTSVAQQRQATITMIKQLKESMKFNAHDYQICEVKGAKYQFPTMMSRKINLNNSLQGYGHPNPPRKASLMPYSSTVSNMMTASPHSGAATRPVSRMEQPEQRANQRKDSHLAMERRNSDLDITQNSAYLQDQRIGALLHKD